MATAEAEAEQLPEAERNALLRQLDWRFLLRQPHPPREGADLVVCARPRRKALRRARKRLAPGGHVLCVSRWPLPGAARRARRRLRDAGFESPSILWPGPRPGRPPHFWLPLEARAAAERLLMQRAARSRRGAGLRAAWRLAARAGLLAPLYAVARAPRTPGEEEPDDEIARLVPESCAWLLLTGGERSINKVVGVAIEGDRKEPRAIVKFARVAEAEAGLEREAEVLGRLERERPELGGVPRVIGRGRRIGRPAVAETFLEGRPLIDALRTGSFGDLSGRVTGWLIAMAGEGAVQPSASWWPRLAGEALAELERNYGAVVDRAALAAIRGRLERLGEMRIVPEHRDCSPWNVILTAAGEPALLDWESAEPDGLPGLDLVYFLANAAFVLDGALESGRTRETYAGLLDPRRPHGRVAAACFEEYSRAVGVAGDAWPALRLLCWVIHSRSEHLHLRLDAAGSPDRQALRDGVFLGLIEEELRLTPA